MLLYNLIKPKSTDEDLKRREFILNCIIVGTIVFSSILTAIILYRSMTVSEYKGMSFYLALFVLLLFVSFYTLSRKGYFVIISYVLILLYLACAVFMTYNWGVELTTALLFYALVITISSILISFRFSFFISVIISALLLVFTYLQVSRISKPDLYWKFENIRFEDGIFFVLLLFIITLVSWLSNREIEKSLIRARKSEAELKKERDNLEITVEERTKDLKMLQMEKIIQLYRFAEFGKLSSGLFHDLVNPLTAVTLCLEEARAESNKIVDARQHLEKAVMATKKIENFVMAIRRQIQKQESKIEFPLTEEIRQNIQMFSYKARKCGVELEFNDHEDIIFFGDQIKFGQIVSNLISNAIDSYEGSAGEKPDKKVVIRLWQEGDAVSLSVEDFGTGISSENLGKIFEPFFTTKNMGKGIGIGLSSTKDIVEGEFKGAISVESKASGGVKFAVKFPLIRLS